MASRYWVGGAGNWHDPAHWSTSSGGAGGASVPGSADDAVFDANSFSAPGQAVTLSGTAICGSLNTAAVSNSPIFQNDGSPRTFHVHGSCVLSPHMTVGSGLSIAFYGGYLGQTIDLGGHDFTSGVAVNPGVGGSYRLARAVTTAGDFSMHNGVLDTNGHNITCGSFYLVPGTSGTVNAGGSVITVNGHFGVGGSGYAFNAGTSRIVMTQGSRNFSGGGQSYHTVELAGSPITVQGSNTFDTLILTSGKTVKFTSGTTQNVVNLTADGATIQATTAGSAATLSRDSGTVRIDNCTLQDSAAAGGAAFLAVNCTDVSGNSGWTFCREGCRESPAIDLGGAVVAAGSAISWSAATPSNTSITVETNLSLDGGSSWQGWQTAVSGGAIPGIGSGTGLGNALLKYRTTLFTSDLGATPSLQELTICVYSQRYKESGSLTSAALSGLTLGGAAVSFIKDTPAGTSLAMEYQESDDGVNWSDWAAMDSGQVCGSRQYFRYRASFGTSDDTVSPVLSEVSIAPRPYALSPAVDISAANDPNSGKVSYSATFNGTSSAAVKTRTSADGSTWSGWAAVDGSGNIQSPFASYLQVLLDLEGDSGSNNPTFDWLLLSYDDQPNAVELASGFTAGGQFYFATLLNKLFITNRLDAPKKWDGTGAVEDLGGNPPHAQYVAVHKNYLFMAHTSANPSRLFFSEVLNPESWPALNFIDVSPNDGDWITGLLPHGDYLIIAKNRSFWVLMGSGPSDFQVKRMHADIGCVAPRSLVRMGESFAFVAHDGIYVSDLVQPVIISERLKNTWKGLNRRRLSQAAAAYYDHKLRVELPRGASVINNFRIVFDNIRKALIEEEFTEHYSCYAEFVETGQEILLAGHASEGQVSQCDSGSTDAGNPINFEWESKHFDFGLPEHIKRWRKVFLALAPAASDTQLKVSFVVEGGNPSDEIAVDIPGADTKRVETVRVLPSEVGVVQGHSLGFRITQSTTNDGVGIHALTLDYFVKGARPTV